jgi:hypothetical protein
MQMYIRVSLAMLVGFEGAGGIVNANENDCQSGTGVTLRI